MSHPLTPISQAKPPVLLSQCLLGEPVRYDGAHKQHGAITQYVLPFVQPMAVCPEVAAGMGVPRAAIRRQMEGNTEVIALSASGLRVETSLRATCTALAHSSITEQAIAAILKARSPSCGIQTSPLFDTQGNTLETGDGVFVQQLRLAQPTLMLIHEEQLNTASACAQFLGLCQLALAWRENRLDKHWKDYLTTAHPLHNTQDLGLQALALEVGNSAELHYLELLPFIVL